jgi:HSP20 family molecular chaperone IbpA
MNNLRRRTWMWADACALLDEAERKHRQFFDLVTSPASPPVWEPPIDIFGDGAEVEVVVALPGAHPEEVTVQLTASGLAVETTVSPQLRSRLQIVRLEIPYGRMRRRIDLPPGRYALIERRLDRGCLYLRLRREAP